jgi:hypothetical protein
MLSQPSSLTLQGFLSSKFKELDKSPQNDISPHSHQLKHAQGFQAASTPHPLPIAFSAVSPFKYPRIGARLAETLFALAPTFPGIPLMSTFADQTVLTDALAGACDNRLQH